MVIIKSKILAIVTLLLLCLSSISYGFPTAQKDAHRLVKRNQNTIGTMPYFLDETFCKNLKDDVSEITGDAKIFADIEKVYVKQDFLYKCLIPNLSKFTKLTTLVVLLEHIFETKKKSRNCMKSYSKYLQLLKKVFRLN